MHPHECPNEKRHRDSSSSSPNSLVELIPNLIFTSSPLSSLKSYRSSSSTSTFTFFLSSQGTTKTGHLWRILVWVGSARLKGLTWLAPKKPFFLVFIVSVRSCCSCCYSLPDQVPTEPTKSERENNKTKLRRVWEGEHIHEDSIVFLKQRDISMKKSSSTGRKKKNFRMVRNGREWNSFLEPKEMKGRRLWMTNKYLMFSGLVLLSKQL